MPAIRKSQAVSALLLLLILAPLADMRPADAPLRKARAEARSESDVILLRQPHPLSRREIFRAIQDDLARREISGRGELRPEDLNIQSSVPVLKVDTGLKVKRIGFDPFRHVVVFELWASQEPQFLPFEVTTRRDPLSWGLTSGSAWRLAEAAEELPIKSPAKAQEASRARSKPPMLAKPGTPATLVMQGQNMRITTTVVPLEPGSKGQTIRVRDVVTARVMTAEVVDEGLLRTSF
jgi:hypothetical protein